VKHQDCLICSLHGRTGDFKEVTRETREGKGLWVRCRHCGLVINFSGVKSDEQRQFYNDEYVRANSYEQGKSLSPREHFESRLPSIKGAALTIQEFLKPDMRIFELGAATGELLYLLKDKVSYLYGNEINEQFAEFIHDELKIDSSSANYLDLMFDKPFDLAIAINTIDHIDNPLPFLQKLNDDLSPGGLLYIETPNDGQALKECLPEPGRSAFRQFMYQRAHYFSFTADTIRQLLEKLGFEVIFVKSRHDYTLLNYLRWHLGGGPQKSFKAATTVSRFHDENTEFGRQMNNLMENADAEFRHIMAQTGRGETLCVLAQRPCKK